MSTQPRAVVGLTRRGAARGKESARGREAARDNKQCLTCRWIIISQLGRKQVERTISAHKSGRRSLGAPSAGLIASTGCWLLVH